VFFSGENPSAYRGSAATYAVVYDESDGTTVDECCLLDVGVGILSSCWLKNNVRQSTVMAGTPERQCCKWTNNSPGKKHMMKGDETIPVSPVALLTRYMVGGSHLELATDMLIRSK